MGKALDWIKSYLCDRSFQVCLGDSSSDKHSLDFGIPQGSVVGPLFFSRYTCDIGSIIRKHDIGYHLYANDVQLYVPFDPRMGSDSTHVVERLSSCIKDISAWMSKNNLKLNNEKSEFSVLRHPWMLRKLIVSAWELVMMLSSSQAKSGTLVLLWTWLCLCLTMLELC